jgi:hypothetical protein
LLLEGRRGEFDETAAGAEEDGAEFPAAGVPEAVAVCTAVGVGF